MDVRWLSKLHPHRVSHFQQFLAKYLLSLDYRFPRPTEIVVEGLENLPTDRPCFVAMNHTDRFNYMAFMYELILRDFPCCCPWVKGKYYQNPLMARIFGLANCIPVFSRGFVIALDFKRVMRQRPSNEEYRALRGLVEGTAASDETPPESVKSFLDGIESRTGRPFREYFQGVFSDIAQEVVRINREALELGHMPLVFPQGTRSLRLSRGHTGIAHVTQYLGAAILPVGCSGHDRLYPTDLLPFSRGGRVVYRVGPALDLEGEALGPYRVTDPFRPLSLEANQTFGERFAAITDVVMDRINELLDPEYRYSADRESDGVTGVRRFV